MVVRVGRFRLAPSSRRDEGGCCDESAGMIPLVEKMKCEDDERIRHVHCERIDSAIRSISISIHDRMTLLYTGSSPVVDIVFGARTACWHKVTLVSGVHPSRRCRHVT